MPELAEVAYYARQWERGMGAEQPIQSLRCRLQARCCRALDAKTLRRARGAWLSGLRVHGKRILYSMSNGDHFEVHLGMTGKLGVAERLDALEPPFQFAIDLPARVLTYEDYRQFGQLRWHLGPEIPESWRGLPPQPHEPGFRFARLREAARRRRRLPVKAWLLDQAVFPGVGNWMADEILWQAGLAPGRPTGSLREAELKRLWLKTRHVCRKALDTVGRDYRPPPRRWLFRVRWKPGEACPRCEATLERETIGGRAACWCRRCQR